MLGWGLPHMVPCLVDMVESAGISHQTCDNFFNMGSEVVSAGFPITRYLWSCVTLTQQTIDIPAFEQLFKIRVGASLQDIIQPRQRACINADSWCFETGEHSFVPSPDLTSGSQ